MNLEYSNQLGSPDIGPQNIIDEIKARSTSLAQRAKENFERERVEYARLLREVESLRKQMEGK